MHGFMFSKSPRNGWNGYIYQTHFAHAKWLLLHYTAFNNHCWIQQLQSYAVRYYQQNQRSLIQISLPLSVVNSTSGHRLEPVWLFTVNSKGIFFSNPWFGSLLSNPFSCSPSQRAASLHPSSCAYPNTQEAREIHSIGRNYILSNELNY